MRATLSRSRGGQETASAPLARLGRFDPLYAERFREKGGAGTRDLMSSLSRPEIISLAGGFPDTKSFGEEAFREISAAVAAGSAVCRPHRRPVRVMIP